MNEYIYIYIYILVVNSKRYISIDWYRNILFFNQIETVSGTIVTYLILMRRKS